MLETLLPFIVSLLIGLLVGIEREKSHPKGVQSIGVRTFTLIALLGAISATINQIVITVLIGFFAFGIILLGYYRSTSPDRKKIDLGITTEISAIVIFCLGYITVTNTILAIILSSFVLLVLIERHRLHALARRKFDLYKLETFIILVIFVLGVLPILPNHTIDPWELFNPRNFGIIVATIGSIQFIGYIAIRLFGERFGMALVGFLGGLVSSTAVFANLANTLKSHPQFTLSLIASSIFALCAMLIEIVIVILVASQTLLLLIIKPIIVMIIVCCILASILLYLDKANEKQVSNISNPLNILSVIKTSIFIAAALIFISITKNYIGTNAVLLVSFLGGLFEIHGICLATALLYLDNNITSELAVQILYLAILASIVSKFFLLWSLTPVKFALKTSLCLLLVLLSGVVFCF